MKQIKDIYQFLLLSGQEIPKEQLLNILAELADKSGFEFTDSELSQASMFVIKANDAILKDYDLFIDIYKKELLLDENYELIQYLSI